MKTRRMLSVLFGALLLCSAGVDASDNETIFAAATGKLIIPHLVLGNDIYFVQLDRTSPNAYNFNLSAPTVLKITPQAGDTWASATEIAGTWGLAEVAGATLVIDANGNFSLSLLADQDCPAGTESGTWTYDARTGIFLARAQTDGNGHCGLSPVDGAVRIKRVGTDLVITMYDVANGQQVNYSLTMVRR